MKTKRKTYAVLAIMQGRKQESLRPRAHAGQEAGEARDPEQQPRGEESGIKMLSLRPKIFGIGRQIF